jgi:hydrogenase maturation protein HypF
MIFRDFQAGSPRARCGPWAHGRRRRPCGALISSCSGSAFCDPRGTSTASVGKMDDGGGAHLKNTSCVANGARAWVGHHIGDLETGRRCARSGRGSPTPSSCSRWSRGWSCTTWHPDYLSTKEALEREGIEQVGVQHHQSHLAACLAEHSERRPRSGHDRRALGQPEVTRLGQPQGRRESSSKLPRAAGHRPAPPSAGGAAVGSAPNSMPPPAP